MFSFALSLLFIVIAGYYLTKGDTNNLVWFSVISLSNFIAGIYSLIIEKLNSVLILLEYIKG